MLSVLYKEHIFKIVCLFVPIGLFFQSHAQNKIEAYVLTYLNDSTFTTNSKKFNTPLQLNNYCTKLISAAKNKGYIAASIDSVYEKGNEAKVIFNLGEKYFLKQVQTFANHNNSILKYSQSFKKNKKYSMAKYEKIKNKIINNQQNKGFPFPTIQSKTEIDSSNNISHYLILNNGEKFSYKELKLPEFNKNEIKYIANITRIKQGDFFKQEDVDNFEATLRNTGVYTIDSINIEYFNNKLEIAPFIKKTKQNSISALLGMQTSENDKTSITGSADLHIRNLLKFGEQLDFNWKKINAESQLLDIKIKFPYIINSPIGIISELKINKRDSSFNKQLFKIGLAFPINYHSEISTYYANISNTSIINSSNNNSTQKLYGLTFNFSNTDNIQFPTKGIISEIDIMSGSRKIKDSESELIVQNRTDINVYFKLFKGSIKIRNLMGTIVNDSIQENELFQLGGTTTIRGFNENSIFSKHFTISSLEYRLLIAKNSHFGVFYDMGVFHNIKGESNYSYRQATGVGLNIETKAGILTVTYAIGKLNSQPLNVNNAKIHVGYIAIF